MSNTSTLPEPFVVIGGRESECFVDDSVAKADLTGLVGVELEYNT